MNPDQALQISGLICTQAVDIPLGSNVCKYLGHRSSVTNFRSDLDPNCLGRTYVNCFVSDWARQISGLIWTKTV